MLLDARLWRLSAPGIALLLAAGSGCSLDKGQRDRNYGTDAGAGYQLPDGGARDSMVDRAEVSLDATPEAAADDTQGIDRDGDQDADQEAGGDSAAGATF
jgi:hypothetical protein